MLPQLTDALVFTIKKTCQLAATPRRHGAGLAAHVDRRGQAS